MIEKILTIEKFGVFNDFNWNRDSTLQDFKEKNIIYGWNYSGKTTLSRIFCSLRDKAIHIDYPEAKFKLRLENNQEFESENLERYETTVFIFNKEYVDAKLTWDSRTELGAPIAFDVGENTTIRSEIGKLEAKIEFAKLRKTATEPVINIFNEYENWRFKEESKAIRLIISNNTIPFDKGHFKAALNSISKDNLDTYIILENKEIEDLKILSNSTNNFQAFDEYILDLKVADLKLAVTELLKEEPAKDVVIDILESNKDLYSWVKDGLAFEENAETCSFCGNDITTNRITSLNNYFSNASKELRDKISVQRDSINAEIALIKSIEIPKSKNDFTERVRETIDQKINSYKAIKSKYISELNHLLNELTRKEDGNIFNNISISVTEYELKEFEDWISELNEIIRSHNSLISNFETERNSAREKLKKHLIADFLKNENYFVKKEKSQNAQNWKKLYENYVNKKESIKQEKLDSLKTITKGKDELNKFIQKFLNRDDIEIDVTSDDRFILLRKSRPARNLSEGEKTAIAFSYFLVELESLGILEMQKTIVFIDDPISSLDTNHISQVYSLINSYFFRKNVDLDNPAKVVNCFKQLFISTHNFEFFSFLRDSSQLNKRKKITNPTTGEKQEVPNFGFYQIQKIDTDNSVLKALSKVLKRYKSEYIYLFSLIYKYKQEIENGGEVYDILIPNALRRFLEIYTLMKIPNEPDSVENRIAQLVDNVNNYKTLNHFSHFTTFEKATRHDELIMVLPIACNELFSLLELDVKHFESLKKAI
ncbi:AAA family ATPase [Winogradskyella immobilis]|uniref:AAA family ATPase n=1 Tax=Winogradskyella immobilis TaxID=2816852 RepID=A0ABS8ERR5_9FLAO|nr:AAA family ATPase [Winogradskyella immobilis]MCC1485572.1 AAA family ATPase [Winogradskyella immobilis]MCG0017664.1 AAA family ATPase [Winogradskyella immobilis]